jgi:signal transduction histidine kinase
MRLPRPSALVWYGLLLVLPALYLGILVWNQVRSDHRRALDELPERVERAGQVVAQAIKARVDAVLMAERERPFTDYAHWVFEDGQAIDPSPDQLQASPLSAGPWEPPRLGWYASKVRAQSSVLAPPETLSSSQGPGFASPSASAGSWALDSRLAFEQLLENYSALQPAVRMRLGAFRPASYIQRDLLVLMLQDGLVDRNALYQRLSTFDLKGMLGITPLVQVGDPILDVIDRRAEPGGALHVYAWRRVTIELDATMREALRDPELPPSEETRLQPLLQAFEIDAGWLFETMPRSTAAETLQADEELFLPADVIDSVRYPHLVELDLLGTLPFNPTARVSLPETRLRVGIDQTPLLSAYRNEMWRFLALATLLAGALLVGLSLLITDVRRKLERAEKMDNFVSAVTHELRTPLSTISLHTEMLLGGYAKTPERHTQYLKRVESETRRLASLVERVLEKSALSKRQPGGISQQAEPSDLSRAVADLKNSLVQPESADVSFDLAERLPLVRLSNEALTSILINLVENARKYAPVPAGGEPILVRTAPAPGGGWLEVLDRGPGIPEEERSKVFEAFYRIGNERTRSARGTGLGLHLVDQQARALGGHVELLGRPGGGAWFRVFFPAA